MVPFADVASCAGVVSELSGWHEALSMSAALAVALPSAARLTRFRQLVG
jgi:hypothetical protein